MGINYVVFLALFFLFKTELKAQELNKPSNQEQSISTLKYQPEIPSADNYKIIKNTTGQQLPDSVLLNINLLRKKNENVEWKVNENIELIIYPIIQQMENGK